MSALTGTVALITGASSGIGAATARALAAEGAAVALVARRADRLDALAAEITGAGGRALAIVADITDRGEADASVARTVDELGRLDILVNNAGLMLVGPIEEAPIDEWDRMIDLNLTAALSMTKAALPHLLAAAESDPRRVADVVNISSTAGRQVKRGSGVYNLTKHGLGAFSESFRQEFSARYVRMALIEPGAVDTELRWPVYAGWARPRPSVPVIAVARTHYVGLEAVSRFARLWASNRLPDSRLIALVLIDDGPKLLKDQQLAVRRAAAMLPKNGHIVWQESWRLSSPSLQTAPPRVRRLITQLQTLALSTNGVTK